MTMKSSVWDSGWRDRLRSRLAEQGKLSLRDFLSANPGQTYESLCRLLGDDFAPIQLLQVHVEESDGEIDEALDSLARLLLHDFRHAGWEEGSRWRENLGSAFAWFARWGDQVEINEYARTLLQVNLPKGWRPASGRDPFLREALSRFGVERLRAAFSRP